MDILSTVRDTVRKHDLLSAGDSVLVGLSGGPDSVALLQLLTRLRKPLSLKLHAVYLNHGLRPRSAVKEEAFCRKLCARWRVPMAVIREDVPQLAKAKKLGFEEAAREVRYRHFERLATELGCARIALGHQADDQVETILFRLLRGTGRQGLLGIPARRGKIIRPLIDVKRSDILTYLSQRKIKFCEDRSNLNIRYRRNLIRHRLLPLLRRQINPQVDSVLRELANTLAEEESVLGAAAARAYRRIRTVSPGGKLMLDLQIYGQYPVWKRRRVLRRAVAELAEDRLVLDKRAIDDLDQLACSHGKSRSLSGGLSATITAGKLVLSARSTKSGAVEIPLDGRWRWVAFAGGKLRARLRLVGRDRTKNERRSFSVLIDRSKIVSPLSVDQVKPGDRFVPLGMRGRKKVGDYLTDRKLPAVFRDEVPVIRDAQGIIWLAGWDIAENVKIDRSTSQVVNIEFRVVKKVANPAV